MIRLVIARLDIKPALKAPGKVIWLVDFPSSGDLQAKYNRN